jgi:hypothetical protein
VAAEEVEIERLVVRLVGESDEFKAMIDSAVKASNQASQQVKENTESVTATQVAAGQIMSQMFFSMANSAKQFGRETMHAYAEAEQAAIRLEASLTANGRGVTRLMNEYSEFALKLQETTTAEDDAVISMMARAEAFGATGEAAKRAARNAIAMEAAFGLNAQSAIRMTTMLEQGNTMILGRFIPSLRMIKDPTERAAKAQEILNKQFLTAQKVADTYQGRMKQLGNEWGNFKEQIGELVAKAMKPVIEHLIVMVKWLQALSPAAKAAATAMASLLVVLAAGATTWAMFGNMITKVLTSLKAFGPQIMRFVAPAIVSLGNMLGAATLGVLAFKVALVAAAGVAVYYVGKALWSWVTGEKELQKAMDKRLDIQKQLNAVASHRTFNIIQDAMYAGRSEELGIGVGRNRLQIALRDANLQMKAVESRMEGAKKNNRAEEMEVLALQAQQAAANVEALTKALKKLDDMDIGKKRREKASEDTTKLYEQLDLERKTLGMNQFQKRAFEADPYGTTGRRDMMEVLGRDTAFGTRKQELENEAKSAGHYADVIARIKAEQEGFTKEQAKTIGQLTLTSQAEGDYRQKALALLEERKQIGLVGTALEVQKNQIRGLNAEKQKQLDLAVRTNEEMKRTAAATKAANDATRDLRSEVATYNMTARERAVWELKQNREDRNAATTTEVARAAAMSVMLDKLDKMKRRLEEAREVNKQFADPQQAFIDRQRDLNEMLEASRQSAAGAELSMKSYNRAMLAAYQEQHARWTKDQQIQGIQTMSGSSVAYRLMASNYMLGRSAMPMDKTGKPTSTDPVKIKTEEIAKNTKDAATSLKFLAGYMMDQFLQTDTTQLDVTNIAG